MFDNVCIVGTGLLGGSLARDLKKRGLTDNVIGVCRSQQTAARALELGLIDQAMNVDTVSYTHLTLPTTPYV